MRFPNEKFLPILSCLIFLYSCTGSQPTAPETVEQAVTSQGVVVDLLRCGEADTTLLFIHGWNINKEYWQAQIDHFCPRYQVVAIDLPGFGKSGRNRSNWAIEVYGRDILQIIRTLELKNVVLIGHSMSGDVMLEAARQDPSAMIGLIGVDNFKEVGKAYSQEELLTVDTFFQILPNDYSNLVTDFTERYLFHENTPPQIRQRVLDNYQNADPRVAIPIFRSVFDYGVKETTMIGGLKHKLLLINSDYTPTDTAGLQQYCPQGYELFTISGVGHFPMVEKPDEFNRLMEKALGQL